MIEHWNAVISLMRRMAMEAKGERCIRGLAHNVIADECGVPGSAFDDHVIEAVKR